MTPGAMPKGADEQLVVVGGLERELIARLELGVEAAGLRLRLELAGAVLEVLDRRLPRELADRLDGPRAEG